MASGTLSILGSIVLQPAPYPPSAAIAPSGQIAETIYVQNWDTQAPTLNVDGQQSIPFPFGMTTCNFLYLKIQPGGSPVTLYVTSADGATQAIPVDSLAILFFGTTVPVTALAVARTAGVQTQLSYVIAQNQ